MEKGTGYISVNSIIEEVANIFDISDVSLNFLLEAAGEAVEFIISKETAIDNLGVIKIEDYRGVLPCGIIEINQVRNKKTKEILVYSTDTFHLQNDVEVNYDSSYQRPQLLKYKVNENYIFVNFKKGELEISYQSIPVDSKTEYPLIPDHVSYKNAVKYHIMWKIAEKLFFLNKITTDRLQYIEQQRLWYIAQVESKSKIPSIDKMESIKNSYMRLITNTYSHNEGFRNESNTQNLKIHP